MSGGQYVPLGEQQEDAAAEESLPTSDKVVQVETHIISKYVSNKCTLQLFPSIPKTRW